MAIKDILVHADTQPGSDGRIAFAASLAKKSEVHLTGLHVKADVVIPVTGNEGMIPQSLIDDQERAIELRAEAGCDLLVMGSYGHSRWREFIFGGVTEDMLEKTTIPIFTSH